jgi:hypothetical protein
MTGLLPPRRPAAVDPYALDTVTGKQNLYDQRSAGAGAV